MAVIQDLMNFVPSWQKHINESGYLKAPGQTDYHQKAGYNFKENFPNTPGYVADTLGKAYQYGTEGVGSFFNDGTFSDAMGRAKEESRLNSLGFRGQGFNMDEYNQTMNFARNGFDPNTGLTYGAAQAGEMSDASASSPSSIIEDEQGNLVDTQNRVQFGNEKFDSEPYEYTPNYLGANSPMLNNEGNATLSSVTNYGYDPAFGQLQNHFYGDTSYPSSFGSRTGYFDDYLQTQQVPSLQRALGNPRFALAPELTSQPQELGFIESAPQPKEAIYQDRIMNKNLSNSNYEPKQGIMQNLRNKIGSGFNNVKDFAMDKGRMGRNLLGSAGAMALGLPGIVSSGAMALMGGMGNQFADKTLYGDTIDENGNVYSADQLNKMNAAGGGYTDPARSARRRTSRISKMRARDFNNKKISQTNLNRLVRQEKAQQAAREASTAARAMARNPQVYANAGITSGGFASQNTGSNSNFSNKSGRGRTGYQEGGLASMFTRRR